MATKTQPKDRPFADDLSTLSQISSASTKAAEQLSAALENEEVRLCCGLVVQHKFFCCPMNWDALRLLAVKTYMAVL